MSTTKTEFLEIPVGTARATSSRRGWKRISTTFLVAWPVDQNQRIIMQVINALFVFTATA